MLRKVYNALPEGFRNLIARGRRAANPSFPMILNPAYADDGLVSQHVCDFLTDNKFMDAYAQSRNGIPWSHPGEIHFRAYVACWAAQHAMRLEGDFVECGVMSGLLAKTICGYLDFGSVPKRFFLYDTFHGIPIETLTDDGEISLAARFNKSHYADDLLPLVRKRFAAFPNVVIVKGTLPDILRESAPEHVSYLSIDMNNAPAEIGSIEFFWDRLVSGAIVLLDDYAYGEEFRNQKTAWDDFARSKGLAILSMPTGQGLLLKI